jgi:hypothetical protein
MDFFQFRERLQEGPAYRKRFNNSDQTMRLNISGSRRGPGASFTVRTPNATGLGASWNTKSGMTFALRGTGLRWDVGKTSKKREKAKAAKSAAILKGLDKWYNSGAGQAIFDYIADFDPYKEMPELVGVIESISSLQDLFNDESGELMLLTLENLLLLNTRLASDIFQIHLKEVP